MTISNLQLCIPFLVVKWKVARLPDKTLIEEAILWISYKLYDLNARGRRKCSISAQEWTVCAVEIEMVAFVVNWSVKLTSLPIDSSESRQEAEVVLSVVSLFSISTGYSCPRYFLARRDECPNSCCCHGVFVRVHKILILPVTHELLYR